MASRSVNKVFLIGHLGRDAETKFTPSGASVTRFSVATTRSFKKGDQWVDETNWTNVSAWQKDKLANYLTKGTQVHIEGRLQTRSYDDKDGKKVYATEVVADEVILLGNKSGAGADHAEADEPAARSSNSSQGRTPTRGRGAPPPTGDVFDGTTITDDDVPF